MKQLSDIENKIEGIIFAACVEGEINTVKLAKDILALIKEAGYVSKEEAGTIAQWFEKGRKSVLRNNPSGCSCLFDEQDDIVSVCGAHEDWYEERKNKETT